MPTNIGKRVHEPLNKQITEEFIVAYTYLSMSSVLSDMGLDGCAQWTKMQFAENIENGVKIYNHIIDRCAKAKLLPIPAPKQDWRAPLHIFEEIARLEQKTTTSFSGIMDASAADKDHATYSFLKYFIDKQIEKESVAASLLDRLRKMQSTDLGVIMFDSELARKTLDKKAE